MSIRDLLPAEATGTFLGRLRVPGRRAPVPVLVTGNAVHDISGIDPTISGILETRDLPRRLDEVRTRPADWAIDDIFTPAEAAPADISAEPAAPAAPESADAPSSSPRSTSRSSSVRGDLRRVDGRAPHRGALRRRSRQLSPCAKNSPRRSPPTSARSCPDPPSGAPQGGPHRQGVVVAVSRSRHRSRPRGLHEGPGSLGRRVRGRRRHSRVLAVEQSRARTRPRRRLRRCDPWGDDGQRRQPPRRRGPQRFAVGHGEGQQPVDGDRAAHQALR